MENEMNHPNSRLPPTPGELALAALMAGARDLQPVDPAAAERAYVTTVAWVSDHADTFFARRPGGGSRLGRREDQVQGVRPAVVPATGTDLAPAVLTCQGGCNRYSADPDQGMRRGVRP